MNTAGGTAFFTALWGVCRGTWIFPELRRNSGLRTIWHLLLMSFLCALMIAAGDSGRTSRELAVSREHFRAVFGEAILFSPEGIRPERDPAKPRFVALPAGGGLIYTGESEKVTFPAGFCSGSTYFALWSDYFLAIGVRVSADEGDGEWQIRVVDPERKLSVHEVGGAGLSAFLESLIAKGRAAGGSWALPQVRIGTDEIFRIFRDVSLVSMFISEWFYIFVLALLCTACFAGISRFTGAAALRGIGGWEYWKIGVYAGFPGMLIGAAAEALELPYIAYGVVYSLALVIYWLPASIACVGATEDEDDRTPRA